MKDSLESLKVFDPSLDVAGAIERTKVDGFRFERRALNDSVRNLLGGELQSLPLESNGHVEEVRNKDMPTEVRQRMKKYYTEYTSVETPVANFVVDAIHQAFRASAPTDLKDWNINSIGYHRYSKGDFISPHRDSLSDEFLRLTFTLTGSAVVVIYEPLSYPIDYKDLQEIYRFKTSPGSMMMLRADGLGSGERMIHRVLPTRRGRSIINLVANRKLKPL